MLYLAAGLAIGFTLFHVLVGKLRYLVVIATGSGLKPVAGSVSPRSARPGADHCGGVVAGVDQADVKERLREVSRYPRQRVRSFSRVTSIIPPYDMISRSPAGLQLA